MAERRRGSPLIEVTLDRDGRVPLSEQLYRALKDLILRGGLRPGAALPATRVLSRDLGVSRNTVLAAYDQLAAEGYTTARPGAGTRVSPELPVPEDIFQSGAGDPGDEGAPPPDLPDRVLDLPSRRSAGPSENVPFLPGLPDVRQFPFDQWGRAVGRFWRRPPMDALDSRDIRGFRPLRRAIADYLATVRGLTCFEEQIIVTSGAQQGIDLCARVLLPEGAVAVMETPGYRGLLSALTAAGAAVIPAPVDNEGLDIEAARMLAPSPRLVAVTPSHQFPLGATMSLPRRLALLDWAREAGFWVLEDDYDSEYRYAGRPLAALQGLDGGRRVIYAGTFSKVMFPSLRLGYLVVPEPLVDPFLRLRGAVDEFPALALQPVLADFMETGKFGAHVRRMRQLYGERQAVLCEELTSRFSGLLAVPDDEAGMHLTLGINQESLVDGDIAREAAARGCIARSLSAYCHGPDKVQGLVLGYAAFTEEEIRSAAETLEAAVTQAAS